MLLTTLFLVFCCLLVFVLAKKHPFFQTSKVQPILIGLLFVLKLSAGISIWYIYTNVYQERSNADIYKYFDDAHYLFQECHNQPKLIWEIISGTNRSKELNTILLGTQHWDKSSDELFNDNQFLIRVHFVSMFLSRAWLPFHVALFSFISFLGSFALFKFFYSNSRLKAIPLLILSFLVPNFLFWSSGMLKEAVLIFALGLFLHQLNLFLNEKKPMVFLYALLFLALMCLIKPYVFICLLPGLFFWVLSYQKNTRTSIYIFLVCHLSLLLLVFLFQDSIVYFLSNKQLAFIKLSQITQANSSIEIQAIHQVSDLFMAAPSNFITTLFRPFVWEARGVFSLVAGLENLILICLPITLFFLKKPNLDQNAFRLTLFALSFVLILGVLIGSITPVLGAIVRYKIPLIPFYLVLVFNFAAHPSYPWTRPYEKN